ncbi:MAG: phosphoribosylglycinamide formyltransferase [archaeon]
MKIIESKNNIAVLASTNATDMQPLIDAIKSGKLNAIIKIVISNKIDAGALERAKNHGIKALFIDPSGKTKEEYDSEISSILDKENVKLVLLIGYMKLIGKSFIDKYKNKIMNIHPSLLPAFAGGMDLNVHEEVLARGCKYSGASLIFIDEGADTGPIIMQKTVAVDYNDTPKSLKKKVQEAEADLLLRAIPLYFDGKINVIGNKVIIR